MDVALATSAALPGLSADDRRLLHALREIGVDAEPAVWEDPHYAWSDLRACVIRSAWDYAYRRDGFVDWARRVGERTALWNSAAVVEWNTHKRYLVDLDDANVPVVPTAVLPAGSTPRLPELLAERGWHRAVIKAAVAQTGRYLLPVEAKAPEPGERHLARLLPHEDMLVQPRIASVGREGEVSLVFLDGEFSHAVRKRPAAGDFRVHDDFDGTVERADPDDRMLAVARRAAAAAGEPLLYARVDLVADEHGEPVVMELELVEPDLFFGYAPDAAGRLAAAVARRLR